ncbi:hypothetical protein [Sneathiella limimaris]|uniref:hypothetical protein n=1 Tax=Sneathiella limimaris TaxID=1964213 RepID=UPI00146B18DA|nr:hypothetical protein [Sneathiella limimaris]
MENFDDPVITQIGADKTVSVMLLLLHRFARHDVIPRPQIKAHEAAIDNVFETPNRSFNHLSTGAAGLKLNSRLIVDETVQLSDFWLMLATGICKVCVFTLKVKGIKDAHPYWI